MARTAEQKPPAFYIPLRFESTMFPAAERDYAHYFLNLLHWKWVCHRADSEGFVRLKYDYITRIIPRGLWRTMAYRLQEAGVIEWDLSSEWGRHSHGFRLAPGYRRVQRVCCSDRVLSCKIRRVYDRTDVPLQPVHRWLESKLPRLKIDQARAHTLISKMLPDDPETFDAIEYRLQQKALVQRFVDGELPLSTDAYGRVHTPLTQMAKSLRCCLRVGGEPLVMLDLANSQPLIAGLLARQFYGRREAKRQMLVRSFDNLRNPYRYAAQVVVQTVASRVRDNLDEYLRICQEGRLYEELLPDGMDRDKFKVRFFQEVFFGKGSPRSKLWRRFYDRFWCVAQMLQALKTKDYRRSSWVMQNYEATIFIHNICNRIREQRPRMTLFTIHDALLVRAGDQEFVRRIVMQEFRRFDIQPTLRLETY